MRIITILDVFDALVASDRPYKKGKSVGEALDILHGMVSGGKLDKELVEQFEQSRCWETKGEAEQ